MNKYRVTDKATGEVVLAGYRPYNGDLKETLSWLYPPEHYKIEVMKSDTALELFRSHKPTAENFDALVCLAVEKGDPDLSIILALEDGKKALRADYVHAYKSDGGDVIWAVDPAECREPGSPFRRLLMRFLD